MGDKQKIEQMRRENPLVAFSVYSHLQVEVVKKLGREIVDVLNSAIQADTIDSQEFERAYGLFWLWILSSYEIVRTMCQARSCFSADLHAKLHLLKKKLSLLRMPFAKQELQGERVPISGEASVADVDIFRRDVGFSVKGDSIWMRDMIGEFETVFNGISREDVLKDHRQTY